MKRALVFSDSHGRVENILDVIKRYQQIDMIFHLGDIQGEADRLRNAVSCAVPIVRGNCDFSPELPESLVINFFGKKVAMTHGHRYLYAGGTDLLRYFGKENEADIVMFGHTHVPFLEQGYDLTLLNPGSIARPRQENKIPTFTVMELDERGELTFQMCEYKKRF